MMYQQIATLVLVVLIVTLIVFHSVVSYKLNQMDEEEDDYDE